MSWEQLLDILRVNEDEVRAFESEPPAACPNGGFPLQEGPDGVLNCPEGDFTYEP